MIRGLYTSGLGMTTQMSRMNVVSNNIANADTDGYKRDIVATRSFSEELMSRLDDPSDMGHDMGIGRVAPGVFVDDIYTDHSNGTLKNTGGPLDVALMGEGFFVVNVKDAEGAETLKYTRCGAFTLTNDGTLMTKEGNTVQGENGVIKIPHGAITIDEYGRIYSNSEYVDKLRLVNFEDKHTLRKTSDTLYDVTEDTTEKQFNATVASGFLENSNVNSVKEMIDMITVSRTYEANQRMVTLHDTIMAKAANDIGRK